MAASFRPKRFPMAPEDYTLDVRIRHIEDWLGDLGGSGVSFNVQANSTLGNNAAASAGQGSGGGGGGGGGVNPLLGGDVTGPAVNNTVSKLQTNTLAISGLSTGDLLEWDGTKFLNTRTLNGSLTAAEGVNFSLGTTTGTKWGTATNQKQAWFNAAPRVQATAYTLAGSATHTFPTDPSSAYTGIDNAQAGTPYAQVADLNTLRAVVSSLEGVLRQLVSDFGTTTSGFGFNAT